MPNLISLKTFASYDEAKLMQNLLEAQGVKSVLQRGNLAAASKFTGDGDAELFIDEKDRERALEILAAYHS